MRRLPNLGTVFKNYKVDFAATIKKALALFSERKKAAEYLGISRSTLYRKMKQYHLED